MNTSTCTSSSIPEPAETRELNGGIQAKYKFPNGYGASVVRSSMSYGGADGLWELGVLDAEGHLTYDTPVTDDVIGYLSDEDIEPLLRKIAALPAEVSA